MARSLVVHSLRFHRKRHPSEAIAPSNLDGVHLLDHMSRYFMGCTYDETRDEYHRTMIEHNRFDRLSEEACLMHLAVAKWGEESRVLNPDDLSRVEYHIKRDEPVSTITRAYCYVPINGEVAFFFSEYSDRVSAGLGFLSFFRRDFVHSVPLITLKPNRVFGAEDWLKTASLEELRINVKKKSPDIADKASTYSGLLTYAVKPDSFSLWGHKTLQKFLGKNESERAGALIEVAEDFGFDIAEADSVSGKITLKGEDGKSTTFSLGENPRAPYLYIPINNPDGTELSDNSFISKCEELASDYAQRY